MRILITGVTGFAGNYLATTLSANKMATLFGVARNLNRLPSSLSASITCFSGDLKEELFVYNLLKKVKPDVVYHLAGQAFVPTAWSDPWGTFELNVRPQLNLLKSLIDLNLKPRFLSVTSSKVYGEAPTNQMPITETSSLQPDNPYGLSKTAQDLMGHQYYLSHQLPIIRARSFNHIGPGQNANFVTAAFARQIALVEAGLHEPLVKVGNLTPARDFTDVRDVVNAYIALIEKGEPGEAYNIGAGKAVTVQYVLDYLIELSTKNIKVEQDPTKMRPTDQPISYADINKIETQVGWRPTIPLEQSLQEILNYWRQEVKKEMK